MSLSGTVLIPGHDEVRYSVGFETRCDSTEVNFDPVNCKFFAHLHG